MLIYRVECPTCTMGPYNCKCEPWRYESAQFREKHSSDFFLRSRPGMLEDFPREHMDYDDLFRHYSGFESRAQMCKWFEVEELHQLHRAGFRCAIFSVDALYYHGKSLNQVFFIREGQWLMRTRELPHCGGL
jgi:hypothetical protein